MLNKNEFLVLRYLAENVYTSQRAASECLGISVGTVNSLFADCRTKGLIENNELTKKGYEELEPHKVDNAIILAAGMATRFAPVSYEIPKGLISVKGDVLIERMIGQLRAAGTEEIVVVIGHMMEKFLYLRDKYGVKFVVNNEYATKNTHSSIYAARDYLKNTYICCADNYYPENMFHRYEYRAFYCAVFLPGVGYAERSLIADSKGLIVDTERPSHDQWIMYGHAYYDNKFTSLFKPVLENYYGRPGVENMYWETIYAENVKSLPMYIQKCTEDQILEFDSVEELKAYDPDYIVNNNVSILDNICKVLGCSSAEVESFEPIKSGLNNKSFKFSCKGKSYVYRHPGINAEGVIDRKRESFSLHTAKDLGIDETLVYIDEETGWKISKFIITTETFDFANKDHIKALAGHLKKLHNKNVHSGAGFNYMEEADRLISEIKMCDIESYKKLVAAKGQILPIAAMIKNDGWQVSLCHNDIYEPNLLVDEDKIYLIDWEFAGDSDIGFDICKLFAVNNPDLSEIDEWLGFYYGRPTTPEEKQHLIACAAVVYYYWFVWGVYSSKNGTAVSDYLIVWYDKMRQFTKYIEDSKNGGN